jgi:hypothetical protein
MLEICIHLCTIFAHSTPPLPSDFTEAKINMDARTKAFKGTVSRDFLLWICFTNAINAISKVSSLTKGQQIFSKEPKNV